MKELTSEQWNAIADVVKEKLESKLSPMKRNKLSNALGGFVKIKPIKRTQHNIYRTYKRRALQINAKPLTEVEFYRTISILEEIKVL